MECVASSKYPLSGSAEAALSPSKKFSEPKENAVEIIQFAHWSKSQRVTESDVKKDYEDKKLELSKLSIEKVSFDDERLRIYLFDSISLPKVFPYEMPRFTYKYIVTLQKFLKDHTSNHDIQQLHSYIPRSRGELVEVIDRLSKITLLVDAKLHLEQAYLTYRIHLYYNTHFSEEDIKKICESRRWSSQSCKTGALRAASILFDSDTTHMHILERQIKHWNQLAQFIGKLPKVTFSELSSRVVSGRLPERVSGFNCCLEALQFEGQFISYYNPDNYLDKIEQYFKIKGEYLRGEKVGEVCFDDDLHRIYHYDPTDVQVGPKVPKLTLKAFLEKGGKSPYSECLLRALPKTEMELRNIIEELSSLPSPSSKHRIIDEINNPQLERAIYLRCQLRLYYNWHCSIEVLVRLLQENGWEESRLLSLLKFVIELVEDGIPAIPNMLMYMPIREVLMKSSIAIEDRNYLWEKSSSCSDITDDPERDKLCEVMRPFPLRRVVSCAGGLANIVNFMLSIDIYDWRRGIGESIFERFQGVVRPERYSLFFISINFKDVADGKISCLVPREADKLVIFRILDSAVSSELISADRASYLKGQIFSFNEVYEKDSPIPEQLWGEKS